MRTRRLLIVTGVLAIITIAMSFYAHSLPRFPGDLELTLRFQSVHSDLLLSGMKWVSYFAEGWRQALLVIIFGITVWWRLGKSKMVLTIAAETSNLLVYVMKFVVGRPRPTPDLIQVWEVKNNASFPSGHAFFAMVVLGLTAYFALTYVSRKSLRMVIVISLLVVIILIGASRVYLGAHWPSDVMGGYTAGAVFLGIFIWLDRVLSRRLSV